MFANLIESTSHQQDLARKGRFFLATLMTYALLFACAGVASIYAYDAHLEDNQDLVLIGMVPPIVDEKQSPESKKAGPKSSKTSQQKDAPAQRTAAIDRIADSKMIPDAISANKSTVPEIPTGKFIISNSNTEASFTGPLSNDDTDGSGDGKNPLVKMEINPPPAKEKADPPKTKVVNRTGVLNGEATFLPKPPYPPVAKAAGIQGTVNVQIMIDETGKIVSARASSGNPTLHRVAVQAAYGARFKPTLLNGVPVKVSGIIAYNFSLQ